MTPPAIEPVLPGLRQRNRNIGDDELLLRYMYGDEKINGLGPTATDDQATGSRWAPIERQIARTVEEETLFIGRPARRRGSLESVQGHVLHPPGMPARIVEAMK
ncbi:hypothetical protein QTI33_34135 [Variovorax sp. J22P271]|uniref:hypothetical protein n=1 Tax=Variovorax davisae TaxID=3053515 RepID=UPI0025771CD1|nr:hypothetical protein [Variovorax sp. J22P271]MDM0037213.1 hypothetical protein [Variovorax sp. J22P271]